MNSTVHPVAAASSRIDSTAAPAYRLADVDARSRRLARGWLWLALAAPGVPARPARPRLCCRGPGILPIMAIQCSLPPVPSAASN